MTPRERVLATFRREVPDEVPWVEVGIDEGLQIQLMGGPGFDPPDLCRRLGLSAFGYTYPKAVGGEGLTTSAGDDPRLDFYYPTKITFDFPPPWIARMDVDSVTGRKYVGKGLLTSRSALDLFDRYLPDPDHPARYERVARWLEQYRQEYAVFARIRLGATNTLESMGLDVFGYALYDDPGLIHDIHRRFSEWTARVVRHLNEMDFDFIWATDDLACNSGPFMSPQCFREFFLPHMKLAASEIKKPWAFHSDGDLFPLLPDLLSLGMSAIHPIQPRCMDLGRMKREYGHRVAIVGNIDLDYTLTLGTTEEVDAEVKERIAIAAPGGGYAISSANSLTDYCKTENVLAMARAVEKYGRYPIQLVWPREEASMASRRGMMTPRERVRAALNHQEPDRVPVDLGSMHTSIETYAYEPLKRHLGVAVSRPMRTFTRDHVDPDPEILELFAIDTRYVRVGSPDAWTLRLEPDNSFLDEFGTRWQKPPGSLYFDPVAYPLGEASLAELDRYPWPDPHDPGRTRGLRDRARQLDVNTDYAVCLDTVGLGVFESCWGLRGLQNFFCDLAGEPEFAYALLGKVADFKIALYGDLLDAVGEYVDVVFVSDDLGTQRAPMVSPRTYRELIKPHQARVWRSIKSRTKAKLFMHSCGSVRAFIPDFTEMGLDILNPVQPLAAGMNSAELKSEFGERLSFWGAIDEQGALSSGRPEEVREEVRRRIRDLAPGGGFVLGPSHNIQGDVSPQNIVALYQAAQDFGRYPIEC